MAVGCYFSLGDNVTDNIVLTMSEGWERIVVEVMLLLHLVTTFPIITNPPAQFFEKLLHIPSDMNWKRCAFRSLSVLVLLFIAESVPSFGAILELIGASTVTILTFIFPPLFYLKLMDASSQNKDWIQRLGLHCQTDLQWFCCRSLPLWERVYCYFLIILGVVGGCIATVIAFLNILSGSMSVPCYVITTTNMTMGAH